jgi:hypothetical protein
MTKNQFYYHLNSSRGLPCEEQIEYLVQNGVRYEDSLFPSVDTGVLESAIDTYGTQPQTDKAVEEMSELIQALMKERSARMTEQHGESIMHVAEELVDAYITLSQLVIIFRDRYKAIDKALLQSMADYKIERLSKKL